MIEDCTQETERCQAHSRDRVMITKTVTSYTALGNCSILLSDFLCAHPFVLLYRNNNNDNVFLLTCPLQSTLYSHPSIVPLHWRSCQGGRLGMGMGESVTAVTGFPVQRVNFQGCVPLERLNDCIRVTSLTPSAHTCHHFLRQPMRKITGKNKKVAYWYLNSVARLRAAGWDTRSSNSTKTWSQMTSDSWYLRQIAPVNHEQQKRPHQPDRQRLMNQDHSGSLSAAQPAESLYQAKALGSLALETPASSSHLFVSRVSPLSCSGPCLVCRYISHLKFKKQLHRQFMGTEALLFTKWQQRQIFSLGISRQASTRLKRSTPHNFDLVTTAFSIILQSSSL